MNEQLDQAKIRVADFYSRVASSYDRIGPTVFSHFGRRMVERAAISPGATVLDIATGRGANLFAALEKVGPTGYVTGIDIAEAMVNETHAEILRRGLNNAHVQQMDAEKLTFSDNSFDYILCNFAIFWFPQQEQALAEFYRVLRPGGTLGVTLPGDSDERWRWYYQLMDDYFKRYQITLPPLGISVSVKLDEFIQRLTQANFVDNRSSLEELELIYTDEQEWWNAKWMHGERYPLENMPSDMLNNFKTDVLQRVTEMQRNGGINERWRIHAAFATKTA